MGFGTLFGVVLPARELWWHQWTIMVMPTGAFFMLALLVWLCNHWVRRQGGTPA